MDAVTGAVQRRRVMMVIATIFLAVLGIEVLTAMAVLIYFLWRMANEW